MFRIATPLCAAALTLALAACAPGTHEEADPAQANTLPPAAGPTDDALTPGMAGEDPCDADAVQSLIGQQASEEVVEQARIDAGAETVRTLSPGQVVTMEYRQGRLNVDLDDAGTITGLRCG